MVHTPAVEYIFNLRGLPVFGFSLRNFAYPRAPSLAAPFTLYSAVKDFDFIFMPEA